VPALGEAAHITSGDDSIDAKAKRLWFEIVQECTRRKIPVKRTPHGVGYLWSGSIQAMAVQVWPYLLREGRMSSPAQGFISEVRNHLKANKNIIFEQVRGQMLVSSKYHEPKKKSSRASVTPTLATDTLETSIPDRAKAVWAKARSHAEDRGCQTEEYQDILFWRVEKPLSYFIHAVFPDLHAYEGGRAPIYDFLRATTNAVNISKDPSIDSEHAWLIRDSWNDSATVLLFRSVSPDRIDQRAARLSPHEAGEDREPAPVEVRKVEETMTAEADTSFPCPEPDCDFVGRSPNAVNAHSAAHKRTPIVVVTGYTTLPDGRVQCDECSATFKEAGSIPGHKKQHYNERREAEIGRLEREVRRLRAAKTGDITLTVEAALRTLQTHLDEAMTSTIKTQHLNEQVSKLKDEVRELRQERLTLRQTVQDLENKPAGTDASTMVELLSSIVDQVNSGKIAPIRAMADVDDLLRTMREGQ
jgi:hypothetical protein